MSTSSSSIARIPIPTTTLYSVLLPNHRTYYHELEQFETNPFVHTALDGPTTNLDSLVLNTFNSITSDIHDYLKDNDKIHDAFIAVEENKDEQKVLSSRKKNKRKKYTNLQTFIVDHYLTEEDGIEEDDPKKRFKLKSFTELEDCESLLNVYDDNNVCTYLPKFNKAEQKEDGGYKNWEPIPYKILNPILERQLNLQEKEKREKIIKGAIHDKIDATIHKLTDILCPPYMKRIYTKALEEKYKGK